VLAGNEAAARFRSRICSWPFQSKLSAVALAKDLQIRDEFQVDPCHSSAGLVQKELLPEKLQTRESPTDRRKGSEGIFERPFESK
jgi:hypothetical protein